MGARSTSGNHDNVLKADGHLLEFLRSSFGFGGGAALPLSNILFNQAYTNKSFGKARGAAQPFISVFQISGTLVAARMFDVFGNYELAFLTLGFILIVPIIAIWFMKKESKLAS